jgi:hypothetical protein
MSELRSAFSEAVYVWSHNEWSAGAPEKVMA